MKTIEIVEAYKTLSQAKYQKMNDDGKVKVWKITRLLKPIVVQFEEDFQDAKQKFIPDNEFMVRFGKAVQYEQDKKNKKTSQITDEEYQNIVKEYNEYNSLVNKAIKEFSEKEVELNFEHLSEDDFEKLIASNDWTISQLENIEFIIG